MSADTKRALDEAIAAHVESEGDAPGSVVTGYALIASYATVADYDDEITRYLAEYTDRQPLHVALGLVHRHRLILETGDDT